MGRATGALTSNPIPVISLYILILIEFHAASLLGAFLMPKNKGGGGDVRWRN